MIWSFRTNGNYVDFIHTDETDLHEEILVHRLHNTSRCIDWSLPVDTTRISFTIDETRYENVSIYDIDFDGTSMNVQGDFETGITAMFTGLAGGGGSYMEASVTLTDEQIKTLDDVGVVVIPAPGVGKIVSVISWQLVMDFSAGAYSGTGVGTNALQLYIEDSSNTVSATITIAANSTTPEYLSRIVATTTSQFFISAIENKAIEVWSNLSNNLTGGHADNTLKVLVQYVEIDV